MMALTYAMQAVSVSLAVGCAVFAYLNFSVGKIAPGFMLIVCLIVNVGLFFWQFQVREIVGGW